MRPARVLYVVETLAPCGTTDLVRQLACQLDRRRFAPGVLALRAEGSGGPPAREAEGARRLAEAEIPADTLALDPGVSFRGRIRPLVARLARQRPDVIHAHSRPGDLWSTWAAASAGVPVRLYTRQATYGGLAAATRARYALTARIATRVVAPSEAVRSHLVRREGVPRGRIELIHDGIDLEALARPVPAAAVRRSLGVPEHAPLVGCVASLEPRKGAHHLVSAAARLRARHPEARFVWIGDGPEREILARRIASLGLADRFLLPGFRADFADCIAALDVFVLPSLWEGFNLSLLTACALGRAVVATHLASNREMIVPGTTGLLPTPPEPVLEARDDDVDPDALADAIHGLLQDSERRARLGARARQHAWARFGARAMAARHEELYGRLLRRRARARAAAPLHPTP